MEIQSIDKEKYSDLDLYELASVVEAFLKQNDYLFVRAVYLCRGVEQGQQYTLLVVVPPVPEDMAGKRSQLMVDLQLPPHLSLLHLARVYKDKKRSEGNASKEWMWWPVENVKDIEDERLHDFVQTGEPVCLYAQDATEEIKAMQPAVKESSRFTPSDDFSSVTKDGKTHFLTRAQARIIEYLYKKSQTKQPYARQQQILDETRDAARDYKTGRLRDYFKQSQRGRSAYAELVERHPTVKGLFRFKI